MVPAETQAQGLVALSVKDFASSQCEVTSWGDAEQNHGPWQGSAPTEDTDSTSVPCMPRSSNTTTVDDEVVRVGRRMFKRVRSVSKCFLSASSVQVLPPKPSEREISWIDTHSEEFTTGAGSSAS